jgi:hypothetical protein
MLILADATEPDVSNVHIITNVVFINGLFIKRKYKKKCQTYQSDTSTLVFKLVMLLKRTFYLSF